jgi:hypothetical protein
MSSLEAAINRRASPFVAPSRASPMKSIAPAEPALEQGRMDAAHFTHEGQRRRS